MQLRRGRPMPPSVAGLDQLLSRRKSARASLGARSSRAPLRRPAARIRSRRAAMANKVIELAAEPYPFAFDPGRCALLIIDMQRDFLEPGGFGEMLGNDVSQLRRTIEPNRRLLAAWRAAGLARSPHARRPPARPVRSAAGQEDPRPQRDLDRRSRTDGPHPGARRARPRHHRRALPRSRASR